MTQFVGTASKTREADSVALHAIVSCCSATSCLLPLLISCELAESCKSFACTVMSLLCDVTTSTRNGGALIHLNPSDLRPSRSNDNRCSKGLNAGRTGYLRASSVAALTSAVINAPMQMRKCVSEQINSSPLCHALTFNAFLELVAALWSELRLRLHLALPAFETWQGVIRYQRFTDVFQ